MIASIAIGLLAGLLIGRRFRVFALIPVECVALVVSGLCMVAGAASPASIALGFLGFSLALQGAYAVSLAAGLVAPASPSNRLRKELNSL